MSRVTPVMSKIARAINSLPVNLRTTSPLIDTTAHTHHASGGLGASLMPKYADLLRERKDSSRGMVTTHRPTPQPVISNRSRPLMQSFHSSASSSAPAVASSTNLDAAVLPPMDFETVVSSTLGFRMPLLPDNYTAAHGPTTADTPAVMATIVAADPTRVEPASSRSAVDTVGLDGIDIKFIHESEAAQQFDNSTMLRDLWKGMVDDVLGAPTKKTA